MPPLSRSRIAKKFAEAKARLNAGDLVAARQGFSEVHEAVPGAAEPLYHLGHIARMRGALTASREYLEAAAERKPGEQAILRALAEAQVLTGKSEAALKTHDALIALNPRAPGPLADKALLLQQQGDFDAADAVFRKALRLAPDSGELYRMWLGGKTLRKGDPNIRKMQQLFADPRMNANGRIHLGFALAKAMEDIGAHDRVFGYLDKANALQRKAFPYDPAGREAEVKAIMAASETVGTPLDRAAAPIIVTGLPRSGTTLVEQILGAHDAVRTGGELAVALRLAYGLFGTPPDITPLHEISDAALTRFADNYGRHVAGYVDADGARVTDKSIQNHLILGHFHRAMPRAALIVVRRDPRDVALSIYKNHFVGGRHGYSNDLANIARYIKSFDRIVDFWKARVPVHEIAYEDLISDPEAQSRALIKAAGLEWQPQCLDFHTRGGAVRTLSLAQVRQPIYQSSSGAWRRHEKELKPFIDAWEAS